MRRYITIIVSLVTQPTRSDTVIGPGVPRSAVLLSPYFAPPQTAGPFCVVFAGQKEKPRQCGGARVVLSGDNAD
jgi:hypothetical protein